MQFGNIHLYPLVIDFDLLDAGNVVHHPNYLVLCERARAAALVDAGHSLGELWKASLSFALVETHSKYFRPALLGQKLAVLTTLIKATGATLTLQQELVLPTENSWKLSGYQKTLPESYLVEKLFWVEMRLGCIKLNPLRPTRIPENLVQSLNLSLARSKQAHE